MRKFVNVFVAKGVKYFQNAVCRPSKHNSVCSPTLTFSERATTENQHNYIWFQSTGTNCTFRYLY